jgi:hypothetical protein
VRRATRLVIAFTVFGLGCEPPPAEPEAGPSAAADTTPIVRQRVNQPDAFDGCYFQGQRFSLGAVKIQDGVRKKCIEEGIWHNVDGFGNLTPEDPSIEDTLSAPDTIATATTTTAP